MIFFILNPPMDEFLTDDVPQKPAPQNSNRGPIDWLYVNAIKPISDWYDKDLAEWERNANAGFAKRLDPKKAKAFGKGFNGR